MVTYVPDAVLKVLHYVFIYPQNSEIDIFNFPILQVKKLKHKGVKYISQGHVSSKIQNQDLNIGSQMPQSPLKTVLPYNPCMCVHKCD